LESIRKETFWILDLFKGKQIKNNYHDIQYIIKNSTNESVEKKKKKYVNDLLEHATETTRFYSKFKNYTSLNDFPVIDKNIIRNQLDNFISAKFNRKGLTSVVTSGSTGTPFKVYHDKTKINRNYADTIFFAELAGYRIGHRLMYMKIWAKQKMRNTLHYRIQNMVPIDVIRLNDDQMHKLINKLEKSKATFGFLGYASAMEELCKYLDKTRNGAPVKANVRSIISMSESLNDYTRKTMTKYFATPAVSRYSNLENGIIAQQLTDGSGQYLVNTASYVLELLKLDSNIPAEPGEAGRIVITDLFNYAMPFIRYDTGDLSIVATSPNQPGKLFLSSVEGRKLDQLYDTKGNRISSYIMYKNMWQYTEIDQYQLIQNGEKEYLFKINVKGDFFREDQLKKEFISYLGDDAVFEIEYVNEIPLLASGKRKKIVNNYIKK